MFDVTHGSMRKLRRGLRSLVSVALLLALHSLACQAQTTIQVPGSVATIQGAINQAHDGDTIEVAPGTYTENINFLGKAVTVTSGATSYAGAAGVILQAAGDGPVVTFDTSETTSSVLNGFTIRGGHTDVATCTQGGGVYIHGASPMLTNNVVLNNENYGVYLDDGSSAVIQGNDINGNHPTSYATNTCSQLTGVTGGGAGVFISAANSPQIVGNTIENNQLLTDSSTGQTVGAGINIVKSTNDVLIESNIVRNNVANDDGAIATSLGVGYTGTLTLVQNLIYNNSAIETQVYIAGSYSPSNAPVLIETNNTIYGPGQWLVLYFGSSTIDNNILYNPTPAASGPGVLTGGLVCADIFAQQSPLTIQNNDIYIANFNTAYACPLGSGNLAVDPNLADPAGGDYHEQATSPTVAAGLLTAPSLPAADLAGKNRTVCGTVDMGAYEMHPTPPVSIVSSNNPAPGGSAVTFTAHVTSINCNELTGTVSFLDGQNVLGTAPVDATGTATFTTTQLTVGQHTITAAYPGDFNFRKNTSEPLTQVITGDPTATTLAITPNPGIAYTPITLTSTVTSQYGTPTGSVTFVAGGTLLATAPLNAQGGASATLGAGTYSVVASYSADNHFQASSSGPVVEVVKSANSMTSLSASANPTAVTQAVTFSVQVKDANGNGVPTGTVTLTSDGAPIGAAPLNGNGTATVSTANLAIGSHAIIASYGGSSDFNASSARLTETIVPIGTTTSLTASPNPANTGQAITLTAHVQADLSGIIPVGSVNFLDGTTSLGSATLNSQGQAVVALPSLSDGTHTLTAVFPGTTDFAGSISAAVNELVQAYDFSLSPASFSLKLNSGDYTILNVTISPIGGFNGTVHLSCPGVPDHTQCVFLNGNSVNLSGGATTVKFAVNTSDIYGYGKQETTASSRGAGLNVSGTWLAGLLFPGLALFSAGSRRRRLFATSIGLGMVAAAMMLIPACSSKLPGETPPGSYSFQLSANSSGTSQLQHAVPVQLTISGE